MQVEIWSDVVCPWCYVGLARFDRAVVEAEVEVEVALRPFELDPKVPADGPPLEEYLAAKFGDRDRVRAINARLVEAGSELGIEFRWEGMRRRNTFDAHRLLGWALRTAGSDRQHDLKLRLLRAHFTDGLDVADHATLADLAGAAGLDPLAASELLAGDDEAFEVRAARERAYGDGINAVPTFVIEGRWMLQGALETDKWVRALRTIAGELAAESS